MGVLQQGSERRWRWLSSGIAVLVVLFGCGGKSTPTAPSPGGGGGSSSPPLSRLELFPAQRVALVGDALTVRVIARDPAGADVANVVPAYSTSNPGVVRIEPDGRLVANGAGTATVRASAGGQTAEMLIHVGSATYDLGQGPPGAERELHRSLEDRAHLTLSIDDRARLDFASSRSARSCPPPARRWLRPRDLPALEVAIFHVNLDPGIVRDVWVDAGDRIGRHASAFTMSDIATGFGGKDQGTLVSYFHTMTDAVFAQYRARGVPSRDAAIITRSERDADQVPCVGEQQFTVQGRLQNWLTLN